MQKEPGTPSAPGRSGHAWMSVGAFRPVTITSPATSAGNSVDVSTAQEGWWIWVGATLIIALIGQYLVAGSSMCVTA